MIAYRLTCITIYDRSMIAYRLTCITVYNRSMIAYRLTCITVVGRSNWFDTPIIRSAVLHTV